MYSIFNKNIKMKTQTTEKLFALIIIIMLFGLTEHVSAQKKSQTIWSCNCLRRDDGCSGLNKKDTKACRATCSVYCGVKVIDRKILANDMALNDAHHAGSQISFVPIILESDNSSELFENKKNVQKLTNNSETQFTQQME